MEPIATRSFESDLGPAEVRIFAPQADQGDFRCEYEIVRNGRPKRRYAMGMDAMQALLLAISGAKVDLLYPRVGQRDETLRFDGDANLGLDLLEEP